ncbi:AraC family transcriptional regulator [Burkholderia guangdongensis]|uniref:AraC family transcriptional regulator n=1 Tax=Burkholderia guangdongensis TaxID=1792500 RepID=UPI0015C94D70|nr:GyrI-like domain-containing protein [Burkholderia guangdongensis]
MFERNVTIRALPEQAGYAVEHRGEYAGIGAAFAALAQWADTHGFLVPQTRWIGVFHDNPDAVPAADLRSQAVIVPEAATVEPAPPVERIALRGGDYAVLLHRGPYPDMKDAYRWLFQEWLPKSGRGGAGAPPFELYLNTPDRTAPEDLLTEIHVPLQ